MKKFLLTWNDIISFIAILLILFCNSGCSKKTEKRQESINEKSIQKKHSPFEATLTITPGTVMLDRDTFLKVTVKTPSTFKISIQTPEDRFEGFIKNGEINTETEINEGRIIEKKIRLTPLVASEYRIAPLIISYEDNSSPPLRGWFYTPPVKLDYKKLAHSDIVAFSVTLKKLPASTSRIIFSILTAVTISIIAILLSRLIKFILRKRYIKKLSPRERALFELRELLDKKLLEKDMVKDFYIELTFVVRRFIERAYGVRAPELTTEEFLVSISNSPLFTKNTTELLKKFLEAADLVKFAAYMPDSESTAQMIKTAENYIVSAEIPEKDKKNNEL